MPDFTKGFGLVNDEPVPVLWISTQIDEGGLLLMLNSSMTDRQDQSNLEG